MDEYITKDLFNERMGRVDDENNRQNHRLDLLEKNGESLNDLVVSVKELALGVKQMQAELVKQGQRLEKIEQEPADKWKKFTWLLFSGVVGLVVGYLASHLGL